MPLFVKRVGKTPMRQFKVKAQGFILYNSTVHYIPKINLFSAASPESCSYQVIFPQLKVDSVLKRCLNCQQFGLVHCLLLWLGLILVQSVSNLKV